MKYNIEITKKNIKTIRVSVKAGTLLVSAPKYVKDKDIMDFIKSHSTDIEELIEKDRQKLYQNSIENGRIYLFGELINEEDAAEIKDEKKLEDFYRRELTEILPYIFSKYNRITGLQENEFRVRKMTARWGTCYPKRGLINISLYLAKRSIREIESVVLHELVHLKIHNHSGDFYREVKKYMSDYDEITKILNS